MKRKFTVLLCVLAVVCMIFSCSNGGGSDSGSSQKAVAVGFDLNIVDTAAKSISVKDQSYDGIQFWYRAIPQWTSQDGIEIQGDTKNNFVKLMTVIDDADPSNNKFTYDNPSGTVGYFAQGQWAFDVEVRTADGSAVLWKTASPVKQYINSADRKLTITVTKNIDSTKTGTVKFDVTAPKTANTDLFKVFYKLVGAAGPETEIPCLTEEPETEEPYLTKGGADDASVATLTGSCVLKAGIYSITVRYYSAPGKLVGASTTTADVIPGGDITVKGSVENNKWQQTTFTIKGMYKLAIEVIADADFDEVADMEAVTAPGTVVFTCTPTIKELDGSAVTNAPTSYIYEWRVNGETVDSDSDTYEWELSSGDAGQDAYVECLAYFKDGNKVIGSAAATFKLKIKN